MTDRLTNIKKNILSTFTYIYGKLHMAKNIYYLQIENLFKNK